MPPTCEIETPPELSEVSGLALMASTATPPRGSLVVQSGEKLDLDSRDGAADIFNETVSRIRVLRSGDQFGAELLDMKNETTMLMESIYVLIYVPGANVAELCDPAAVGGGSNR
ncbi:hypothetical protein NUW58_g6097 [Xylaria curta]|uniref:Uncharacterized protein n=1 Tax=Xylaria curta TaxID=42375 RepID=A0ACC1NYC8_9PEZI|nr:hypothetical protein NUW58_g6097 [Xylaria curta]